VNEHLRQVNIEGVDLLGADVADEQGSIAGPESGPRRSTKFTWELL